MALSYEDLVDKLIALMQKEGFPSRSENAMRGLAKIMVLTQAYGEGDALAGVHLREILGDPSSNRAVMSAFERYLGYKPPIDIVTPSVMIEFLDGLASKYQSLKLLSERKIH